MKIVSLVFWIFIAYVVFNWHSEPSDTQASISGTSDDLPVPIPKAPPPSITDQIASNDGKPTDQLIMLAAENCRAAVKDNWSGYGDADFSFKDILNARYSYTNGVIDIMVPFRHQNMYGAKVGDYAECHLRAKDTDWTVVSYKP